jgi:nicotinamidase-related amidase
MHYQNENCHPDDKIKVGIAQDADWRWQRLNNAKQLVTGARDVQIPIVQVRLAVPPDYWGVEFVEGLEPKQGEPIITHIRNSGFHGSTLLDILNGLSARHLICCGVSTAYAVEGMVRQAADIGFEVTVAADACSTATQAQHANALAAMNLIADVKTVDRILEDFK